MSRVLLLLFAVTSGGMGCQARQVAQSGMNFRQSLLTMYTDQAMDNLVRAKTNQPFVQIAYRNLTVQDLDSLSGTGSLSNTTSSSPTSSAAGALLSVLHSFTNVFTASGSASRAQTLSFQADPITDQNDIYLLYRAFATDPNLFVESDSEPGCPVHIMTKSGGKFYWVPTEAAPVFFELVMRTTFMRGPDLQPPAYYPVKIARVLGPPIKDKYTIIIELSGPIPNGDADMTVLVKGKRLRLALKRLIVPATFGDPPTEEIPAVDPGESHPYRFFGFEKKQLTLEDKSVIDPQELVGLPVQVYSRDYPPTPPKTSLEIKRLLDNQDLIRMNLNNLAPNH